MSVFITMKYILTESRLHDAMINLFEKEIEPDEVKRYNYIAVDDDGGEYETDDAYAFYKDDEEEDLIFRYYKCEFFNDGVNIDCPIIDLEYYYKDRFSDLFGDLWVNPFLLWANEKLNLNAKVVE